MLRALGKTGFAIDAQVGRRTLFKSLVEFKEGFLLPAVVLVIGLVLRIGDAKLVAGRIEHLEVPGDIDIVGARQAIFTSRTWDVSV